MVLKVDIEKAVAEQQVQIATRPAGVLRSQLSGLTLNQKFIMVITGVRRCGKSTLMQQFREKLDKQKCLFFNFEDPRLFSFDKTDFPKLKEVLSPASYLFLDEVQNFEGWELFVRNLQDDGYTICLTGSNASLLSRELGTRLTGRNIQVELFPFSYNEFLKFKKQKAGSASLQEYLVHGGFPGYLEDQQSEVLQQLLRDVVYRDIIVRHGIRNDKVFMAITLYLLSNVGKDYSLNGLKNVFSLGSVNTASDYVSWLEDSYLLFSVPAFSWSLKSQAVRPKKMYAIDTGFIRANSLSYSSDSGRLLENAVFLQLRRKFTEIFYFRAKKECDFVVRDSGTVTAVYQVCLDLNGDNQNREIDGLQEAINFFGLESGTILTLDQEDTLVINGKIIHVTPTWKWMVEFADKE